MDAYKKSELEARGLGLFTLSSIPVDRAEEHIFGLVLVEARRLDEAAGELVEGARLDPEDVDAQLAAALAAAGSRSTRLRSRSPASTACSRR